MRLMKLLSIMILALASSMAMAKDNYKNVNCSKLDNDNARKACREHKYGSSDGKAVDCSKLDNDKLRHECRKEKWN